MSTQSLTECFSCGAGYPACRTISITGAGGKTSLMYGLAAEFVACGETVITTTTTKIFPPDVGEASRLVLMSDDPKLLNLPEELRKHRHVTVGRSIIQSMGKVDGIDDEVLKKCLQLADRVVVEADGASGKPVKAPEEWEPVIPVMADLVIPVMGLDCLGKPATDQWVFRLERFLRVTGLQQGEQITPQALTRLLAHPEGALKGVGVHSQVVPFLNKDDLLADKSVIDEIAHGLRNDSGRRIKSLVYGSLKESRCNRVDLD